MDLFRHNLHSLCSAMKSAGVAKITVTYSAQDRQLSSGDPIVHWPSNCTPIGTDDHTALGDIEVLSDALVYNDDIAQCELLHRKKVEPFQEVVERLFIELLRLSELTVQMFSESTYGVFTINQANNCEVVFRVPLEDPHVVTYSMSTDSVKPARSAKELKPAKTKSTSRAKKSTTK